MGYGTNGTIAVRHRPRMPWRQVQDRRRSTEPLGAADGPPRTCKARVTVTLPPDDLPESAGDARAAATSAFRRLIEWWIASEGLRLEVAEIIERPEEGAVVIRCSSRAKRRLREQFITTTHTVTAAASA